MVNFFIYAMINKCAIINKSSKIMILLSIFVVFILHTDILKIGFLMTSKDFFRIFVFSFSLIVFHVFFKIASLRMNRLENKSNFNFPNYIKYRQITNFIKFKLIYLLITAYQIAAVFNHELR